MRSSIKLLMADSCLRRSRRPLNPFTVRLELLKRGVVIEHEYLDCYGMWMATLVVRAGDCT
jgi:hypothetical protein